MNIADSQEYRTGEGDAIRALVADYGKDIGEEITLKNVIYAQVPPSLLQVQHGLYWHEEDQKFHRIRTNLITNYHLLELEFFGSWWIAQTASGSWYVIYASPQNPSFEPLPVRYH